MNTLQTAGEALDSADKLKESIAKQAMEIERHEAAIERKNKLLADTLQTLHNYCAAEFALYGDTTPLIFREAIAAIQKELTP